MSGPPVWLQLVPAAILAAAVLFQVAMLLFLKLPPRQG